MSTCISQAGEYSDHELIDPADPFTCQRCFVFAERAATERLAALEATCDELAAAAVLLAHDAHPVYGNTTGWRGGIGGQAMTPACSIIDPPPGVVWTQFDMPTEPARDWLRTRDVDLEAIKARLRDRWTAAIEPAATPTPTEAQDAPDEESGAMTYPTILPTSGAVLAEVSDERGRQDAKWGEQNHPDGTGRECDKVSADRQREACERAFREGWGSWSHILREEVAEAFAESDPTALRAELVQVAAVAVAWVEAIDRRTPPAPDTEESHD